MCLSALLLGAYKRRRHWFAAGAAMIAIDTLVHAFLHRSGILRTFGAEHAYGPRCYGPNGCAALIGALSERIDAERHNVRFPRHFPRFVQHAVWSYCAEAGHDVCNGNRIDDRKRCGNISCSIYGICFRIKLK
ncbi:MAG: hypothetical protein K2Y71_15820 [Xanthobacteraceae bacterium]|nr:hypothetical protein [Xanthobacteraceae bacterium]